MSDEPLEHVDDAWDEHPFFGGRLTLRQFRRGHRAGTDAVLLAAATPVWEGSRVLDIGAGTGGAALAVLAREPAATATLIERHRPTADFAIHNIDLNGYADRAHVQVVDIFDRDAWRDCASTRVDVVISNPPFFEAGRSRASPNRHRERSHVLDPSLTHVHWVRRLIDFAEPAGTIVLIHRPDALSAILTGLEGRTGHIRVRPVYPKDDQAAIRVLVTADVGSRAPLKILAGLVLHQADGSFTSAAQGLHQDARAL